MKLLKVFTGWRHGQKLKRAKRALEFLLKEKDPDLYYDLGLAANKLANGLYLKMLERQGIAHCSECTNTMPLRKIDGRWFCHMHPGQEAYGRAS